MSLVGKIFAVISLIIAVFYAGITAALVSMQENFRKKHLNAEAEHKQAEDRWKDIEKNLNDKIGRHETTIKGLNDSLTAANGELKQRRQEWRTNNDTIDMQKNEIAALNATVKKLENHLDTFLNDNNNKKKEITRLEGEVARVNGERDVVEKKYKEVFQERDKWWANCMRAQKALITLKKDYEFLDSIVVRLKERDPELYRDLLTVTGEKKVEELIRGKITAVDKDLGLVIINRGQKNGVQPGMVFIVYRGDKYVVKVRVDEVFPDVAAATYVPGSKAKGMDAEVGDDVTNRLSVEEF